MILVLQTTKNLTEENKQIKSNKLHSIETAIIYDMIILFIIIIFKFKVSKTIILLLMKS